MDTNFVNKEDIIYEDELIEVYLYESFPIEYPPSSDGGIAIIYHIEGLENKEAAFSDTGPGKLLIGVAAKDGSDAYRF
ncbi:hypothetical protein C1646_765764 [Rhizophagus diaphanus]|nr:hypothetical protein C1646_765764 [Rhizophagus diaphanus] [Rhizophagus sp. MUCL 43196]